MKNLESIRSTVAATIEEAAAERAISRSTVERAIAAGELSLVRYSRGAGRIPRRGPGSLEEWDASRPRAVYRERKPRSAYPHRRRDAGAQASDPQ